VRTLTFATNRSHLIRTLRTADLKPEIDLIDASFEGRAALGTGVSAALLRRVARGELPATMRIHGTGRTLAFGRIDRLAPGYPDAVAIARERGYEPVERMAGGRAAVFHEGTIAFSRASRERNLRAGTGERFEQMAELLAAALRRVGVDARIGEVPGEYCPGGWSVSWAGRTKLAGIGQRVIAGGAHVGGVLVLRGANRVREVLVPVYEALGVEWDPATAGSVAEAIGAPSAPPDEPDPLLIEMRAALRAELTERYRVHDATLDAETLRLAEALRPFHVPSPRSR
jgi:octanoyl-[GcvH]:protein N-octanoyltransferase